MASKRGMYAGGFREALERGVRSRAAHDDAVVVFAAGNEGNDG